MQPTTLPAQQGVNEFSENNTHQQNLNLLTNRKKISGLPSDNERKQLTTDDIKNLNLEKKVDERHDTLLMHAVEKNDLDIRYIKKILNGIFKVKVREGINNPEAEDDADRIKMLLMRKISLATQPFTKQLEASRNEEEEMNLML